MNFKTIKITGLSVYNMKLNVDIQNLPINNTTTVKIVEGDLSKANSEVVVEYYTMGTTSRFIATVADASGYAALKITLNFKLESSFLNLNFSHGNKAFWPTIILYTDQKIK